MALPPLNVKVGADVKGLNKGLGDAQKTIARFATAGVAGATAVGAAMIGMTKASMANIDVLAKQARSLGLTTNAFQRMALVAEEAGVEAGKLSSMLGLMQRNIVELQSGTQKQVDTFNALGLSLSDLQGLSPDEQFAKIAASLDSITDPAEKTAAAMEVFGRSGRDAINMLNGYGAAAANAEAFQRRFGIAVAQDVAHGVERANDAVGRLGMVMQGLGNQMAGAAAPAIERAANALIDFMGAVIGAKVHLDEFFASAAEAEAILGRDVYNALKGNAAAIVENSNALQELATIYGIVRGPLMSTTDALSAFSDALRFAGMDEAATEMMDLVDQAEALDFQFKNNGISAGEFDEKMQGVISRADDLVLSLRSVSEVGYQGAIRNLGDLRTALVLAAQDAARLVATLPGSGNVTTGTPLQDDGNLLPPGQFAPTTSLRPQMPGVDSLGNFMSAGTSGGGGGGGGTDPNEVLREQMATRLETLMESLMTERETVANWYAEGLELIQNSSDAELDAIGGKQEAIERLEKEHQARLSRIRELGAASDLATVLGAGNEILTAIGQNNEKALRIAKAFGAAEALISAYQGAANALKLPFPKNIAAAASVLAKGIGFVNAIKGVSKGGGSAGASAGGGGAGAAAVAEAPQQQVQSLNFTVMSDPFGIGERVVRQIASQLNEAQRNGNTLIRANVV
jgi:hypothetical protein